VPSCVKRRLDVKERTAGDDFLFFINFDKARERESSCFG
jgi:hypothetical protein